MVVSGFSCGRGSDVIEPLAADHHDLGGRGPAAIVDAGADGALDIGQ
jgi:hypothetical protein